jgi:hypothetical protein
MPELPRLLLASPHRYPDLARLWHRAVRRDLLPALEAAGFAVQVRIFRDGHAAEFAPDWFPGAVLEAPRPGIRDFVEFYDAALAASGDRLFLLDADVFFLDGAWPVSYLGAFDRPEVAAVSYLRRGALPGVYALLCRAADYRALPAPVFAASYEGVWPKGINRGPGERAALALRAGGREIVEAVDPEVHLADFHGTTVLRASREIFGGAIGERRFEELVGEKRYFAMGAYDNLLLGTLYGAVFGAPFAVGGKADEPLGGSLPAAGLARALARVDDPARRSALRTYFQRSDRAISRLAAREGIELALPRVIPESWDEAVA